MSSCIGKKRWETGGEAERALDTIRGTADAWMNAKVPVRTYACDVCLGWHLTAMSENASASRRRPRARR